MQAHAGHQLCRPEGGRAGRGSVAAYRGKGRRDGRGQTPQALWLKHGLACSRVNAEPAGRFRPWWQALSAWPRALRWLLAQGITSLRLRCPHCPLGSAGMCLAAPPSPLSPVWLTFLKGHFEPPHLKLKCVFTQ